MRVDADALAVARARTRLRLDSATGRTAARRGPRPLADCREALLVIVAEPERLARVATRAAAAAHAGRIAGLIDRDSRAELVEAVGADARAFAIAHRAAIARSAIGAAGAVPLVRACRDTAERVELSLVATIAGADGPTLAPAERAALELAIAAEGLADAPERGCAA